MVIVEVKGSEWVWKVIYRWNQQEVLTGWTWDGVVKVRRESVVGKWMGLESYLQMESAGGADRLDRSEEAHV